MKKTPINIRVDPKLLKRIDRYVAKDIQYRDRTHFVEVAAHEKLERAEKEK